MSRMERQLKALISRILRKWEMPSILVPFMRLRVLMSWSILTSPPPVRAERLSQDLSGLSLRGLTYLLLSVVEYLVGGCRENA